MTDSIPTYKPNLELVKEHLARSAGASRGVLFGLVFFIFGIFISGIFIRQTDFQATRFWDRGNVALVEGSAIDHADTNYSINHRNYYRTTFNYQYQNKSLTGFSYGPNIYQTLQSVPVELLISNPEVSRIQGDYNNPFPILVLLVLIFPFVGFMIVITSIISRIKTRAYLQTLPADVVARPEIQDLIHPDRRSFLGFDNGIEWAVALFALIFFGYMIWQMVSFLVV